jgi:DNA-directed RNA polymerase specialized sigma24 family protein
VTVDAHAWRRRPGESAQDWLARLQAVDRKGLTDWQRMGLARATVHARRLAGGRPVPAPEDTPALRAAKAAVRGLSRQERAAFVLWVAQGLPGDDRGQKP